MNWNTRRRRGRGRVGALVLDTPSAASAITSIAPVVDVKPAAPFVEVKEDAGSTITPSAVPAIASIVNVKPDVPPTATMQALPTAPEPILPLPSQINVQAQAFSFPENKTFSLPSTAVVDTIPIVPLITKPEVVSTPTIVTTAEQMLNQSNSQAYSTVTPTVNDAGVDANGMPTSSWASNNAYWTCKFCGNRPYGLSGPGTRCSRCGNLAGPDDVVVRDDIANLPPDSLSVDSEGKPIYVSLNQGDAVGVIVNPPVPVVPSAWNFNAAPRVYSQGSQTLTSTATYTVQRGNTVQGIARTYLNDARWIPPGGPGWPGGVNKINVANTGFGMPYNADHIDVGQVLYMPPEAAANAQKLIDALNRPTATTTTSSKSKGLGWTIAGLVAGSAVAGIALNWNKVKKAMRA